MYYSVNLIPKSIFYPKYSFGTQYSLFWEEKKNPNEIESYHIAFDTMKIHCTIHGERADNGTLEFKWKFNGYSLRVSAIERQYR